MARDIVSEYWFSRWMRNVFLASIAWLPSDVAEINFLAARIFSPSRCKRSSLTATNPGVPRSASEQTSRHVSVELENTRCHGDWHSSKSVKSLRRVVVACKDRRPSVNGGGVGSLHAQCVLCGCSHSPGSAESSLLLFHTSAN